MTTDTAPFILVDGSGYIFRAYYALPSLTRPDGVSVGAVYGFTSMLLKLLETEGRDGLVVIFDAGRKTFRNTIYPQYKEHRPPPPEDLIPQFPLTREACEALGVTWIESDGFEADDLIASYTKKACAVGKEVRIISSDKDLMQLIRPGVTFFDPMKQKIVTEVEVMEKFGVLPSQVCDVLALMGDASDNIPGVRGIGPKGAGQLIERFGSLDVLLDRVAEVEKPSYRNALETYKEQAILSKRLVCLDDEAPLPLPLSDLTTKPLDSEKCLRFIKEQGFSSLMPRIEKYRSKDKASLLHPDQGKTAIISSPHRAWEWKSLSSKEDLQDIVQRASRTPTLGLVIDDNEECPQIALSFEDSISYSILLTPKREGTLFDSQRGGLSFGMALEALEVLFKDPSIMKVGQDIKKMQQVLGKYHQKLVSYQDLLVMGYDSSGCETGQTLMGLADSHLDLSYEDKEHMGLGDEISETSQPFEKKAAAESYLALKVMGPLVKRLTEERVLRIYECVDRPVIPVITQMEQKGILVEAQRLSLLGHEFGEKMAILETQIYKEAGRTFAIGSPKQLGEVLYNQMGLEKGKKGKSGDYSTRADILESLAAQGHTFPKWVLEWRALAKLKNTYADGLLDYIDPNDSRIHTTISLIATSTGRLASSNPNLQNIPIRTEEGLKIRRAFCVPDNHVFLSLDYSQIELRLLAHMAQIPSLIDAFWKNQDIHAATAAQVFNCPLNQVDHTLRRKAKIINFGIIYGISPFGLAQQLGISKGEAKEHIDAYFTSYPGIQAYMEAKKEEARQHGYVETLWGRRCRITDIRSANGIKRAFAERQAINAPLQGTAADIIKKAMIDCYAWEKERTKPSCLLLQIHDELLFEVPEAEFDDYAFSIKEIMEKSIELSIPLVVDVAKGKTWGDLEKISVS